MTELPRSAWLGMIILSLAGIVAAGTPRVYPSPGETQPLPAGSSIPSVTLTTVQGQSIQLAKILGDRGALLVFYRGGW
jgi:hypothetical protein